MAQAEAAEAEATATDSAAEPEAAFESSDASDAELSLESSGDAEAAPVILACTGPDAPRLATQNFGVSASGAALADYHFPMLNDGQVRAPKGEQRVRRRCQPTVHRSVHVYMLCCDADARTLTRCARHDAS